MSDRWMCPCRLRWRLQLTLAHLPRWLSCCLCRGEQKSGDSHSWHNHSLSKNIFSTNVQLPMFSLQSRLPPLVQVTPTSCPEVPMILNLRSTDIRWTCFGVGCCRSGVHMAVGRLANHKAGALACAEAGAIPFLGQTLRLPGPEAPAPVFDLPGWHVAGLLRPAGLTAQMAVELATAFDHRTACLLQEQTCSSRAPRERVSCPWCQVRTRGRGWWPKPLKSTWRWALHRL